MVERPHVVVFSSLFPSSMQPGAGLFVRERMFRVGAHLPLAVVSPTPWFPLQSALQRWRPTFRPGAPRSEVQQGFDVWFPRFLSPPGVLKQVDGLSIAISAYPRLRALKHSGRLDILDAHFGYPDGYAAIRLGRWLNVPVTITLRGTESRHARDPQFAALLKTALQRATRIFAVSGSLKRLALELGVPDEKVEVVGNGVDAERFRPIDRRAARHALGLMDDARVLISVGGLVERKGFHRVIELLPRLRQRWPGLVYLIVGGAGPEGSNRPELEAQVARLQLQGVVRFLGSLPPDDLSGPLSAADVFVLATRNEGWANVFLEAMACGLPVVTTDVGGNREVVCAPELGTVVPFDEPELLSHAIDQALETAWDRVAIRTYAERNSWDERIPRLVERFSLIAAETRRMHQASSPGGRSRGKVV